MWEDVKAWFERPFNSNGNVLNWVLFLGLIIIIVWMWNTVLWKFSSEI
jgi:hypothetical protein